MLSFPHYFSLSNGQYLYFVWIPPDYYFYRLHGEDGATITTGELVEPIDTPLYTAAEKALQQLGLNDVTIL